MKTNTPQKKASKPKTNMIGNVDVFGKLQPTNFYTEKWGTERSMKDTPEKRAMKTATIRAAWNKENKNKKK